jgi:hypothetical protein
MGDRESDVNDDLIGQPAREGDAGAEHETEEVGGDNLSAAEPKPPKEPTDPIRQLVRLGWAMIVVLVVLVALLISGMVRLTNAVDKVACIQRAQTNDIATAGSGNDAYAAGLARLATRIALNKCGP